MLELWQNVVLHLITEKNVFFSRKNHVFLGEETQ